MVMRVPPWSCALSALGVCPGGSDGGFDDNEGPIGAAIHNTLAHHGRGHLRYGQVSFFCVLSKKYRSTLCEGGGGGVKPFPSPSPFLF